MNYGFESDIPIFSNRLTHMSLRLISLFHFYDDRHMKEYFALSILQKVINELARKLIN